MHDPCKVVEDDEEAVVVADGVKEGPRVDDLHSSGQVYNLLQLVQNGLELSAEVVQHLAKLAKTRGHH